MASTRKTGKLGALYLHVNASPALASVVKFANTTNWRFEAETTMLRCNRKGDSYSRFMPGEGSARLSAEARVSTASALLVLADDNLVQGAARPSLLRVAFKLVNLDTQAAGATLAAAVTGAVGQLIQGFGWVSRGSLQVPFDNPIIEDFEIQVDGGWEFVATTAS